MSYADGWAALNLEMPKRIPRTEYSAPQHWDLVNAVTGLNVGVESSDEEQQNAGTAFMRAWNYDFFWSILIHADELGEFRTDMGHAEYAAGGVDRRDTISSPYSAPEDVLNFDPVETLGSKDKGELIARFEEHYEANCQRHDFGVNMTGTYITLFSGLIDLFGWDLLLLAAGTDATRFGDLTNRYAEWMQQYFDALADSNVPVVMVHDDIVWSSGPVIRPKWYREYIFPNYKKYFAPLLDAGKKIMYTSDGNIDTFVDDIAGTGVHGLIVEPWTNLELLVEKVGQTHVIIGGVDTRVLLSGSKEQIRTEVERAMTLGRNCPGFFLAVGNHIPANTPVENALYYNQVYEELCQR